MKAISEELRTDIISASILGNKAFHDGNKRIPCFDKELMSIVNKYDGWGMNSKARIKLLEEWLKNWDLANLYN
jgi:hypothetical protein